MYEWNIDINSKCGNSYSALEPDVNPDVEKEEVDLIALGNYNEESKCIEINWYSDYDGGVYEVYSSGDNQKYNRIGTIDDDSEFFYQIEDDFDIKYFKVTLITEENETIEAIPFIIKKENDGYKLELLDTDKDGLSDIYEKELGTNIYEEDTDSDELSDYQEDYISCTDPNKYDSVKDGVSDSDADADGDKLTTKKEIELGTNPQEKDSDKDGLTDFEEIYVYILDPLKEDTDEDTINDLEEIEIDLNPKNPQTHGMPDADYLIEQSVSDQSEVFSEINTENNPYSLSMEITASGNVNRNLKAEESTYSDAIDNDMIVGMIPELEYDSGQISDVRLKFQMTETFVENMDSNDIVELEGIERYNIFKYFEDLNMLLPIETNFISENNIIYADVDELGTYCLVDMERWFLTMETESEESQGIVTFDLANQKTASQKDDTANMKFAIDVVFLYQSAGRDDSAFYSQQANMVNVLSKLKKKYYDGSVRVCVVTYNLEGAYKVISDNGGWTDSTEILATSLGKIRYTSTSKKTPRGTAFKEVLNNVEFRKNASKYIFSLKCGPTTIGNSYVDQIETCEKMDINYSELVLDGYYYVDEAYGQQVEEAIKKTNGFYKTYNSKTADELIYEHICKYSISQKKKFQAIVPTGWKKIELDEYLAPDNNVDTDEDGIKDWDEVGECMKYPEKPYSEQGLERFMAIGKISGMPSDVYTKYIKNIKALKILPISSNPTSKDSDKDGLYDGKKREMNDSSWELPKDPSPLKRNGPKGIWKTHLNQHYKNDVIAKKYKENSINNEKKPNDIVGEIKQKAAREIVRYLLENKDLFYDHQDLVRFAKNRIRKYSRGKAELGAQILQFKLDEYGKVYHSKPNTWQREFGYNDCYDDFFDAGTDMRKYKVEFLCDKKEYVLWSWKGDYWNLESGAETGLYIHHNKINDTEQYDAVGYEIPMSISLYYKNRPKDIEDSMKDNVNAKYSAIFNWEPTTKQWWATGFNPSYGTLDVSRMVSVMSYNFQDYPKIYEAIKKNGKNAKPIIYDDTSKTIWFAWYKEKSE